MDEDRNTIARRSEMTADLPPLRGAGGSDPVLEALESLGNTLEASAAEQQVLGDQVRELRAERLSGASWRQAVARQEGPGVLAQLGAVMARLTDAGAGLRRALAGALVAEGASTAEVAGWFGVSRQRVFRLLRGTPDATRAPADPSVRT